MPSDALVAWSTVRQARIDELLAAHSAVAGTGPGRRFVTEQLNWSLTMSLAAEFQGYVKDLHLACVEELVAAGGYRSLPMESIARQGLTRNLRLAKGNANQYNVTEDFGRLGFAIHDEVKRRYVHGAKWIAAMERLNDARNGIAHSDHAKIRAAVGGASLGKRHFESWRGSIRQLARAYDQVSSVSIAKITGGARPW